MSNGYDKVMGNIEDVEVIDVMTGFYTHDETFKCIRSYIEGQGADGIHALMSLDIVNLGAINNIYGHDNGDKIITACAEIIKNFIKKEDIVGRVGGDEFLIFVKDCKDKDNAEKIVSELISLLCGEYTLDGASVNVCVSVGASVYGIDGTDIGDLYLKADDALYYAKKENKNNYALYGKHINPESIRAEEKQSLIRLRTLLEYMDGGVILVEVGEGIDIYYASPSFYKMSHRTKDEVGENGENLLSVVVPEDKSTILQYAKIVAKTGESLDFVYRVYESNGGIGWRQIRAARLPGLRKNGRRSIICVITDVTELKESAATLEAVVENSPAGIGIFEIGDNYVKPTFYNSALGTLLGRDENEANVLENIIDHIDISQRQTVFEEILTAVHEERPCEIEFKIFNTGSEAAYLSARGVNLYEQNGKKSCLFIFTDITKEYKLREQIRFEQERYKIAVDLTKAVLWEVDIKTKTTYQYLDFTDRNGTNVKVYENSPDSLIESEFIHPDFADEYLRMYDNLFKGNDSGEYFYKRMGENNEYVWVKTRFRVLKDENGEPLYSVGIAEKVLNIDAQMRRFEQEQYFCDQVENNVLGSIKINLSKNIIENHYIFSGARKTVNNQHNYDEILERSVAMVSIKEDADNLVQKLSRERLFEVFKDGQDWVNVEFRRKDGAEKIRWTSIAMSLLRHPVSGDLYGFAYVRDVDKRRRWELSLPSKVERDAISMVYSRATAFDMINTILPTVKDKTSYCAMCMLDIDGLDAIQAEKGEYMVRNILFTIGRVMRILVDGSAIVGQIDNNRIMVFRVGIGSPDEQLLRVQFSSERLAAMLRMTFPSEKLELYSGIALSKVSSANLHDMYDEAYHACSEAIMHNTKIVKVELSAKEEAEEFDDAVSNSSGRQRDQQTGLMTRQDYYDSFRKLRPETLSSLGVFIADINGLRTINHRYGMEYGDRIIKNVASNLLAQFGEDEVYRVSGDEFLVLCKNCTQDSFINRCDAVIEQIGTAYNNIISVGTTWDSHISDIQKLVDHADELMKEAKQDYYRMNNTVPSGSDYKTYMWVMDAIKDERFFVQLQPKAELANGKVTSCEALVRYIDAESGMIHPAKFIAILERENVIKQLDFYVLNKALDIIDGWIKEGKEPISVSVNFSRRTLLAQGALKDVLEAVKGREYLLPYLCIEITETIGSMERAMVTRVCEMFQNAGFKLALDDFGSEYSNLYIVSALKFDEIKIDKSVIDDIETNDLARLTVENTRRICERTGAILVAEGVETEEQMNILKSIGCHMAQGYHINKPLSPKEFTEKYIVEKPMQ